MSGDLSRRGFLQALIGTGALVAVGPADRAGAAAGPALADPLSAAARWRIRRTAAFGVQPLIAGTPTRTIRWVRAGDQLDVTIDFFACNVSGNQIVATGADPGLRLTFGSQHTTERAFPAGTVIPTATTARTSAGPSMIVVPLGSATPLSVAGLLALANGPLTVTTAAGPPTGLSTELELPAGLVLSPASGTTMSARSVPTTRSDVTEVFVARLEPAAGTPRQVRAIANVSPADLFTRVPNAASRNGIVTQSTTLAPVDARQLWLSSSGAFANLRGSWTSGPVLQWRQRIVTGRDIHADVLTAGFLAPFGVRASINTVADRTIVADAGGGRTSAITMQRFVSILDAETDLAGRLYQPNAGRRLPFVSVRATIDETVPITLGPITEGAGTIPQVNDLLKAANGVRLKVDYVGTDREGNEVSFSLPATFIADAVAYAKGTNTAPQRLLRVFNADAARNQVNLRGQPLALAEPGTDTTTKETHSLAFELLTPTGTSAQLTAAAVPGFAAGVTTARVTDELIGRTLGTPADSFDVSLHPRWIQHGNGAGNFDQSFLKLANPKSGRVGGADSAVRAVAVAELTAEVFNQRSGFGPDLPTAASSWDPTRYVGADARLLGTLKLVDLFAQIPNDQATPGEEIPGTETVDANDLITTTLSMKAPLQSIPLAGFIAKPATKCTISVTSTTSRSGAEPDRLNVAVGVNDFDMVFPPGQLIELVIITFGLVKVTVPMDGPVKCDPKIDAWRLGEELAFLQPLLDKLSNPLGGAAAPALAAAAPVDSGGVALAAPGSGPGVRFTADLSSESILLGAELSLPSLPLGVLRLENFRIGADVRLPFHQEPVEVGVDVGYPAAPLDVAIAVFGGSFHCNLDLTFGDGVTTWKVNVGVSVFVEIDIDVVVAKAAITVRASLSFVFDNNETGTTVKVIGSVSLEAVIKLLGCLEVSAKITGTASYNVNTEKMVLRGTVEWAIDTPIGGFHGKVELGETSFTLGDGANQRAALAAAPTGNPDAAAVALAAGPARNGFGQIYSQSGWNTYTAAFA